MESAPRTVEAPAEPSGPSGVTSSVSLFDELSAEAIRRGQPVRLRINLELYDLAEGKYRFWRGTGLRMDLDTRQHPQLGADVRQSLQLLADALSTAGPQRTIEHLTELVRAGGTLR